MKIVTRSRESNGHHLQRTICDNRGHATCYDDEERVERRPFAEVEALVVFRGRGITVAAVRHGEDEE